MTCELFFHVSLDLKGRELLFYVSRCWGCTTFCRVYQLLQEGVCNSGEDYQQAVSAKAFRFEGKSVCNLHFIDFPMLDPARLGSQLSVENRHTLVLGGDVLTLFPCCLMSSLSFSLFMCSLSLFSFLSCPSSLSLYVAI